ncbi:AAA family ATPase [Xanthomonas campestris]|uniref:AAA family ATPase n=1 Tax=Xanthomonas campestris TaxID=339 RepID=UPI001E637BBF|nr:AAA family ATPase [Xanthomonas campestris]MCC8690264.1 AAA family ATPase [Xanthomonas campestris]MEA9912880.1 AAA family ATPase [Xanthomonas campestris pv. raphani]
MYLNRVVIENVRGFGSGAQCVDISLARPDGGYAGWTVIAGRNGAGKSSFLRAIALSISGITSARSLQESFQGWIRTGEAKATVATQLSFESYDKFEKTGRIPASNFWTGLQWDGEEGQEPTLSEYQLNKKMKQTPERGPWNEDPKGWFVAGYGPFRRLTGHASDAQRLMVGPSHVPRLVSLFREDASLVEAAQWLKDVYLRRLENRPGAGVLEKNTIALLNDGMLPDGVRIENVDSDGLWIRKGNARLPLRDLSDGYRTSIALVLDILRHMQKVYGDIRLHEVEVEDEDGKKIRMYTVPYPGVVLIDEIDVHLHVSWQQRIGYWLKERFPKIQFIVSSHSPFVCQAADPGGLIRLAAPGEEVAAVVVDPSLHKRVVLGTADEAAMSELFGLESTRSPTSQKLLKELAILEAKAVKGAATEAERARIRQLQFDFPLTPSSEAQLSLIED